MAKGRVGTPEAAGSERIADPSAPLWPPSQEYLRCVEARKEEREVLAVIVPATRHYGELSLWEIITFDRRLHSQFLVLPKPYGHTVIDQARNLAVREVCEDLGHAPDYVLFADSDMDFAQQPDFIWQMLRFANHSWKALEKAEQTINRAEHAPDIVGIPCASRTCRYELNCVPLETAEKEDLDWETPFKCARMGCGVLLARGSVFSRIPPPWFVNWQALDDYRMHYGDQVGGLYQEWLARGGQKMQFFEDYLLVCGCSEDYAFSEKARQAGIDIWAMPNLIIGHNGATHFLPTHDDVMFAEKRKPYEVWRERRSAGNQEATGAEQQGK